MSETVAELIKQLQLLPGDAKIRIKDDNDARSRAPFPRLADGFTSSYGYVLPCQIYGHDGKGSPVVWL